MIDISALNPLSPEIIINQSTINIGTIGHVAHGKSTVVKAISGVSTLTTRIEIERNSTIRLGYANAKIYKCPKCPIPECYFSKSSQILQSSICENCSSPVELIRHVSFVDCPGHDILMAVMLNGASVMDAALLLIAANEKCPQPQTAEHLAAIEIMALKHLIILQNKVDLVRKEEASQQYNEILKYTSTTAARGSPIIPISAQVGYNIKYVISHIVEIPVPLRDYTSNPILIVIRSFDINKPGTDIRDLEGGVAGGSIHAGCFKIGDEIEIRPGQKEIVDNNKLACRIRKAKIVSLKAESNPLMIAVPGGLIGVGTTLDPSLCRADRLIGQVLGRPGCLPDIFIRLTISYHLFQRLLGVSQTSMDPKIGPLEYKELLLVNIGSCSSGACVVEFTNKFAVISLKDPVCTKIGERIALSRMINSNWRLIGWATILKGITLPIIDE